MRRVSAAVLAAKHLAATWLAAAGLAAAPQQLHVLVIDATWGPATIATTDVQSAVLDAESFLQTASFGQVELTATVTPWLNAYADESVCRSREDLVAQAEQAEPVDGYDRVVVVTPCAIGSTGDPVTKTVVIGLPLSAGLIAHELGHTFGMTHAGAWVCPHPREPCVRDPYGDPFDVMGNGLLPAGDPGALQKAEAGWLTNYKFVKVPGTYTLAALEVPSKLPQALVVRIGVTDLWIDHREAIGNDAYLKTSALADVTHGVLIHEAPLESLQIPFDDRHPAVLLGNGGPRGLWITKGKTFTIPHELEIDVIRHVGTTVTVRLRKLR
jgi:hypothetical protein